MFASEARMKQILIGDLSQSWKPGRKCTNHRTGPSSIALTQNDFLIPGGTARAAPMETRSTRLARAFFSPAPAQARCFPRHPVKTWAGSPLAEKSGGIPEGWWREGEGGCGINEKTVVHFSVRPDKAEGLAAAEWERRAERGEREKRKKPESKKMERNKKR